MSWIDVGHIDDIPLRGARLVKTAVGCVALFRTSETDVYAASDTCPHKGGPLSEGIIHGNQVTCPLHNWVFSLDTGLAQGADEGHISTYGVRLKDGRVLLDGDAVSARNAA